MNSDFQNDLLTTFAITNYLNAGFQGKFAALNILSQLGFTGLRNEEIVQCREILARINRWNADLINNVPLFSASWSAAETFESMKALDLLRTLKTDLTDLISRLRKMLAEDISSQPQELTFLTANYARYAYSRDNFIRGFIDYGKNFGLAEVVARYTEHLASAAEDIQQSHAFFSTMRDAPRVEKRFLAQLMSRARPLPYIFRTHVHDINQLLAPFTGGFSYESAGFSEPEAREWSEIQINPTIAGYWRAYDFTANDLIAWKSLNIFEPALAHEWRDRGFNIETALPWISINLPPATSLMWHSAGFTPNEVVEQMERGVFDPTQAKSSK